MLPGGVEMVVIARRGLLDQPFPALVGDLTRVLQAVVRGAGRMVQKVGA
jgi:hypothetical protein